MSGESAQPDERIFDGKPMSFWIDALMSDDPKLLESASQAIFQLANPEAASAQELDELVRSCRKLSHPPEEILRTLLRRNAHNQAEFHSTMARDMEAGFALLRNLAYVMTPISLSKLLPALARVIEQVPEELFQALDSELREVRLMAEEALSRFGARAKRAVPRLLCGMRAEGVNRHPYWSGQAIAAVAASDPETFDLVMEGLRSGEPKFMEACAWVLMTVGPAAAVAVPNFLAMLDDPDARLRSSAAMALGGIARDDAEARAALLKAARDPEWFVRGNAVRSLGSVGGAPETVIPALIESLPDTEGYDWTVQEAALEALAAYGPLAAPAVPALIEALRTEYGTMNGETINTLGAIGSAAAAAIPALRSLLDTPEDQMDEYIRDRINAALERILSS